MLPFPSPYVYNVPGSIQKRLAEATRFMRPPGPYKRAKLRNWFYRRHGAFESPTKRFVRLREKSRVFNMIPPPRLVPEAKPVAVNYLKPITSVPTVRPEVLQQRLTFLLSTDAVKQQAYGRVRCGESPYQAELTVWKKQMAEVRRIYRFQYIQKLAQVTDEERLKQVDYFQNIAKCAKLTEMKEQAVLYEDRRRRALLKDQRALAAKVFESRQVVKTTQRLAKRLRFYKHMESLCDFITPQKSTERILNNPHLLNRNISVPQLLVDLKLSKDNDLVSPYIQKQTSYNLYQKIFKESLKYLPEDDDSNELTSEALSGITGDVVMTEQQRAHVAYRKFSKKEKMELLDTKIEMVRQKLQDAEYMVSKGAGSCPDVSMWTHLLDHLEAAKAAHQVSVQYNT